MGRQRRFLLQTLKEVDVYLREKLSMTTVTGMSHAIWGKKENLSHLKVFHFYEEEKYISDMLSVRHQKQEHGSRNRCDVVKTNYIRASSPMFLPHPLLRM
ncbi:hypothetical protein CDAR_105401 [Caerostris darwini]|uniref:Uncharacterized protein n=1 Tax=Caerostris darwini TaxID=1538125 RepID=A0AAV4MZR8_9ARAC|nr:hypothetical protein CDAR_105401 [Caerostris darwini]